MRQICRCSICLRLLPRRVPTEYKNISSENVLGNSRGGVTASCARSLSTSHFVPYAGLSRVLVKRGEGCERHLFNLQDPSVFVKVLSFPFDFNLVSRGPIALASVLWQWPISFNPPSYFDLGPKQIGSSTTAFGPGRGGWGVPSGSVL